MHLPATLLPELFRLAWACYGPSSRIPVRGGTLDQNARIRVRTYLQQSAITTLWFTGLRQTPASRRERQAAQWVGAFTPLYDDLMDEHGLTHQTVLRQAREISPFLAQILARLRQSFPPDHPFWQILEEAGEAQNNSLAQRGTGLLPSDQLHALTWAKGGSFTLLYRSVLEHPLATGEETMIRHLGGILQLTNDLFDVFRDTQQQQQTLVTNSRDLIPLRAGFRKAWAILSDQINHLAYSSRGRNRFERQVNLILARGWIALEQLIAVQHHQGGQFSPHQASRNQLICDMDTPAALWRSMHIAAHGPG